MRASRRSSASSASTIFPLRIPNGAGRHASNSYNLSQDYGRAGFVSRNMVFLMGNYTARGISASIHFLIAQSGRPYNIVSSYDLTGDNFFNDRPAYADCSRAPPTRPVM